MITENKKFDIAPIGELEKNTIQDFIKKNKILNLFSQNGIISTINQFKHLLSCDKKEKLVHILNGNISVAYRGCMICKELYKHGIINEINDKLR